MEEVWIAGVGMTAFGRFHDRSIGDLAASAIREALDDAGVGPADVDHAFFANAAAGLMTGQEMIRGQAALRRTGLLGAPIVNVENACASGSSAFALACLSVGSGQSEVALAVGAEKLAHEDRERPLAALATGVDLEGAGTLEARLYRDGVPPSGSLFMDVYADMARRYAERSGATARDFAHVAVKSRAYAARNPRAQFRARVSFEEVLESRMIADPLRLFMCSPIGDGAAALVLCSAKRATALGARVRVRATALVSGRDGPGAGAGSRAVAAAYDQAGVGPEDLDVVEVHDAAAPAELIAYEELGLCGPGDGPALLGSGATGVGGRVPVNTGGGLLSRGHPVGATGCAQLVELFEQLTERSGERQVAGARIGLAENAGGFLLDDHAAACVTILERIP